MPEGIKYFDNMYILVYTTFDNTSVATMYLLSEKAAAEMVVSLRNQGHEAYYVTSMYLFELLRDKYKKGV